MTSFTYKNVGVNVSVEKSRPAPFPALGTHSMTVPGLPQSGTGQYSLFTGDNGAQRFGRHFGPWVPTMLYQAAHTGTPWAGAMRPTAARSSARSPAVS